MQYFPLAFPPGVLSCPREPALHLPTPYTSAASLSVPPARFLTTLYGEATPLRAELGGNMSEPAALSILAQTKSMMLSFRMQHMLFQLPVETATSPSGHFCFSKRQATRIYTRPSLHRNIKSNFKYETSSKNIGNQCPCR